MSLSANYCTSDFRHGGTEVTEFTSSVIPAKAGIHGSTVSEMDRWIPAFAGMTTFLPPCPPCLCGYSLLLPAAQFASHDLAGRGQRQFVDKTDFTRRLIPGETLADK